MPAAIRSFWATCNWSEDPRIRDQSGNMLAKPTFNWIEACPLKQLGLERTGPAKFVVKVPKSANPPRPHSAATLQRWATAVLLASPTIDVRQSIRQHSAPRLRHAPPALSTYIWSLTREGVIAGRPSDDAQDLTQSITLNQGDDGVH
uniref:RxLR effector candidate protein n=1 Tax=Hyaloperonospora arabidopsidis (strain Emoy2) TaxID=559515 RepID=M4BTZ7_HYAAE